MGIETGALLAYAAIAASTVSTLYQADTAKNTADANAEMQRREGEQEKDNAVAQAEKIRKAGRAAASRANAALANAGVAIGEGTALRINEDIYLNSESDAYSTLLTGTRRQRTADEQSAITVNEGNAAKTGGYLSATSSMLGAGAKYGNWGKSKSTIGGGT